jgi:hypothetical protein
MAASITAPRRIASMLVMANSTAREKMWRIAKVHHPGWKARMILASIHHIVRNNE